MKTLTQARRDVARDRARSSIRRRNGPKPDRSAFEDFTVAKYPSGFTRFVAYSLLVVALASGWISAVRLYQAGYHYALQSLPGQVWIARSIGAATPLAAEVLVIVATIAGQVYLAGRRERLLSFIPVIVGTIVAFVGNWKITNPATTWGWVETCFPPVAVLSVAFIFEVTLVPELERRQGNENAYQKALAEWSAIDQQPETHPDWIKVFATALRDMLCQVNRITVDDHTPEEWADFVDDELAAEDWYAPALQVQEVQSTPEPVANPQETALNFLRANPLIVSELQLQRRSQIDLARELGVSPSAMNRAYKKVLSNGHNVTTEQED